MTPPAIAAISALRPNPPATPTGPTPSPRSSRLQPPCRSGNANGRAQRLASFTLVEIMIVVAIIGTLAAIAIPAFQHSLARAQVARAIADLRAIQIDIDVFELEHHRLPVDLAEAGRAGITDPWGRPYHYLCFAAAGKNWKGQARKDHSLVPLNSSYDLYSLGRDGQTAGPLTAKASQDDIIRANDGGYLGLGSEY